MVISVGTLTNDLAQISAVKLPGGTTRDPFKEWLETIGDMA